MTPSLSLSVRSSIVRATVRLARETASRMDDSLSRPPQSEPATTIGEEERLHAVPSPSELALIAIGWALMISQLAAKTATISVTNA